MKTVVIVAPEFAPQNTAAVNRSRFFASYLPRFGWKPIVLTIDRSQIEGPTDEGLEKLLPSDLEIIRTGAIPVKPIRWVGDMGLRTLGAHEKAIDALCQSRKPDALLIPGPPWFSFLLGPRILKKHGIPYVLDYIDPWFTDTARPVPGSKRWVYEVLAAGFERKVLFKAASVTAVSEGICELLRRRYDFLYTDHMAAMPYGACFEDFEVMRRLGVKPPDFDPSDGLIHIGFTGAIQPTSREILESFFKAIRSIHESRPHLYQRIRIHFYGTSNLTWGQGFYQAMPLAQRAGLADKVTEIPERIDYLKSLAVQNASTFNLVTGSVERYYHASKLYSCLGSGRPLLALCHEDSSVAAVLKELSWPFCLSFRNATELDAKTAELSRQIVQLCERKSGETCFDEKKIYPYSAARSSEQMAGVLDRVSQAYGRRN